MLKVLLLDVENQTKKLKELKDLLKDYDQVILVYAASNLNIALDDLTFLSEAIRQEKLLVIKMPQAGSDSADFGLTFIAGRLSEKLKRGSMIDIMSDDRKMSYAVDLLNQVGMKACQLKQSLTEITLVSTLPQTLKAEKNVLIDHIPDDSMSNKYLKKAIDLLKKNQPKKLESLNKALKSWFKISAKEIQQLIAVLMNQKLITIQGEKLTYHFKEMKVEPKVIKVPDIGNKPHLRMIQEFAKHLIKITKNRPVTIEALGNMIKSFFKYEKVSQVEQTINLLKKHGLIQLQKQKLNYQDSTILVWSQAA